MSESKEARNILSGICHDELRELYVECIKAIAVLCNGSTSIDYDENVVEEMMNCIKLIREINAGI